MMHILRFENLLYGVKTSSPDKLTRQPAIIFLHGAGTRGGNTELLRNNPFFAGGSRVMDEAFPFIVFAPLCGADTWFDIFEQLQRFVKMVADHPQVDPERIYLFGTSMGGYAVWQLAMTMPEYFAAMVPICGGGMAWNAARLKNIPIWAFHGKDDRTVHPIQTEQMVDAVNAAGGNARITLLDHTAHNCWTYAYGMRELFEWLLTCRRTNLPDVTNEQYGGSQLFR